MCAIGTWAAFSLDTTVTYSLTALALISFVGSVSVARFRVPDIASLAPTRSAAMTPRRAPPCWCWWISARSHRCDRRGRFPDTLSRMHSAPSRRCSAAAGAGGAAIRLRGHADVGMFILAGLFTLITAPVVANRVGQLAYREQNIRDDLLTKDEMHEFAEPEGGNGQD